MKAAGNYPLGMPPEVLRSLWVRLAMLVVFAGSAALIWWSVNRLPPLEKKIEEQNARVAAAENDILQMELRWDPAGARETENRFQQANGQLFSGPEEFARWQQELKLSQTEPFRLAFITQAGRTQASPLPNKVFSTTTAIIELQSITNEAAITSPYQRLVELAESITTHKKRVDLLELSASGNSNSVSHAMLRVQVWSQEDMGAKR
jgi:hypothetical protein